MQGKNVLRALLTLSSVLAAKFSCSRMMSRGNPPMVVKRMILSDRAAPAGAMRKPMPERALIAALAIIAVSAAWFATAPTAAAAEAEKFGDWILRCEAREEGQGELCYLHQTINYSKDDVSGMLLDVKIGAFSENEDLYAATRPQFPIRSDVTSRCWRIDATHRPDVHQGRLQISRQNIRRTVVGFSQGQSSQGWILRVWRHSDGCSGGLSDWLYCRLQGDADAIKASVSSHQQSILSKAG